MGLNSENTDQGKMFIGGLAASTTAEMLRDFYTRWGEVVDYVVMSDPSTGRSRGFGFVTYKDPSCVDACLEDRPHKLDGREVDTKKAVPRGSAPASGRGRSRGGGGSGYNLPASADFGPRSNYGQGYMSSWGSQPAPTFPGQMWPQNPNPYQASWMNMGMQAPQAYDGYNAAAGGNYVHGYAYPNSGIPQSYAGAPAPGCPPRQIQYAPQQIPQFQQQQTTAPATNGWNSGVPQSPQRPPQQNSSWNWPTSQPQTQQQSSTSTGWGSVSSGGSSGGMNMSSGTAAWGQQQQQPIAWGQ